MAERPPASRQASPRAGASELAAEGLVENLNALRTCWWCSAAVPVSAACMSVNSVQPLPEKADVFISSEV